MNPIQSYAAVAEAAERTESEAPPAPSAQVVAERRLESAVAHLRAVGRFAQHFANCRKDVSPEAALAGKIVPCSCGLDAALVHASGFLKEIAGG